MNPALFKSNLCLITMRQRSIYSPRTTLQKMIHVNIRFYNQFDYWMIHFWSSSSRLYQNLRLLCITSYV